MIINEVPVNQVWAWRETVLPEMRRVERYLGGRMDADDILTMCEMDEALLWTVHDLDENFVAAIVTRVHDYPRVRCMTLMAAAGSKMKEWLPAATVILKKYARAKGCTIWEIWARKGWRRILSGLGPKELLVVLEGSV